MIISILGIRGILLNRRNILIMSMPIESMLLAVNLNFLVFSVSLDDMMGQSFASLVPTVVLGAPNREGRCGKVWWEYKQAWTEEVDERPPGCVVILNPEKRAHILRKARHAKVPIFFP